MRKLVVLCILVTLASCTLKPITKENQNLPIFTNPNMVMDKAVKKPKSFITIDDVSFEETEFMKILNDKKRIICLFDTVYNKTLPTVNGIKVYDRFKLHLFTLMPAITNKGVVIHIKNISSGKRGKVTLSSVKEDLSLKHNIRVNYFNKKYKISYITKHGYDNIDHEKIVSYRNKIVLYKKIIYSNSGIDETKLFVNKRHLNKYSVDTAVFALCLKLIEDINKANLIQAAHEDSEINGDSNFTYNPYF